jgi:hypothetical protein
MTILKKKKNKLTMERRYIESAAQIVPVSAYGSVALEECRRSADFMTEPK